MRGSERGRSCLDFLVPFTIVGFIVLVAVPNLLTARERLKQKRTAETLRQLATAVDAFAKQERANPSPDSLERALVPRFIAALPKDGWGNPIRYQCQAGSRSPCDTYILTSSGRDGTFARSSQVFDEDIVSINGRPAALPKLPRSKWDIIALVGLGLLFVPFAIPMALEFIRGRRGEKRPATAAAESERDLSGSDAFACRAVVHATPGGRRALEIALVTRASGERRRNKDIIREAMATSSPHFFVINIVEFAPNLKPLLLGTLVEIAVEFGANGKIGVVAGREVAHTLDSALPATRLDQILGPRAYADVQSAIAGLESTF